MYGWTRDDFVKSGITPSSKGGRRPRLTGSVSSDGEGDTAGLVDSGNHDPSFIFGGSSDQNQERGRTRLSNGGRNRQRLRGEMNRSAADSAVM